MSDRLAELIPVTQDNVAEVFELVYAPWIKHMGLTDCVVREGFCSFRLPQDANLQFVSGSLCGQALMAAIDTAASLAASTGPSRNKGTVYQHTHFLRPAAGEDVLIEAQVRRFGRSSAYVDCSVTLTDSGALCTHAVLEFAY